MQKAYYRIVWENYPSDKTPLNEQNLNKIDVAVDEMDNRIISLDSTKFDKSEAQMLVKYIEYDEDTGIFKITHYNGASYTIDTLLEKLAINFDYDYQTQRLIIELSDGTVKYVDLSALLTQYEFLDSETVAFTVDSSGKVTAKVKEGSIGEKHLRPDYLADIRVEAAKAEASAAAAEASKTNAAASATTASTKAGEAANSAANAADSADTATEKATAAGNSATNAASSATSASNSATTATDKANDAAASATNAANSSSTASAKANAASSSATAAAGSAISADTYAKKAQSYAVGTGGVRPNESIDSAKYYYEQSKSISEGLAGALLPMGTVTFAKLPMLADAESGWMYNVSDQFVTTAYFKEGAGNVIPAGANVYKTADGYWDVLAGTPVSSVNGKKGNVVIQSLPANGGNADTVDGKHASELQDYNNLSNKPEIGNGTVTIKQAGASKGTFAMNQSGNTTIELTDNNTTYGNMTAATASAAGKAGLVPAPSAGAQNKVLKGNATWGLIENLTSAFSQASSRANLVSGETLKTSLGKIMKWFADLANGAASSLLGTNLTASRALISNTSGKVGVSSVTSTELGYLDGVTSNIQDQLDVLNTGLAIRPQYEIQHKKISADSVNTIELARQAAMYLICVSNSYKVGALYIVQTGTYTDLGCNISKLVSAPPYFDVISAGGATTITLTAGHAIGSMSAILLDYSDN